jgi:hypothetical protein
MSELTSLASRSTELVSKVDFWNSAVLWALFITALAAGAIVLSQRMAFVRAKQLADVQDRIASIKEADASEHAKKLETDLAKQQERAANAEKTLLELQERVKIRHLSFEQRNKLVKVLKEAADEKQPKGPIRINRLMLDETAQAFATELRDAFSAGGWSSDDVGRDVIPSGPVPIGVVIIFHSSKSIPAHAGVIQHALKAAELKPTLAENPNIPEGLVEILIGIKP